MIPHVEQQNLLAAPTEKVLILSAIPVFLPHLVFMAAFPVSLNIWGDVKNSVLSLSSAVLSR